MTPEPRDRIATSCDCCGGTTLRLTGDLRDAAGWLAFYSVRYTPTHPDPMAEFTLGYGDWTAEAPRDRRWVFGATWSVSHRAFMLRDLSAAPTTVDAIHLDRADILGTPFAADAFAMLDAVLLHDARLEDLQP